MDDNGPQETTTAELPPDVEQLMDQADVIAVLQQHGKALDAHRKEFVLMWLTVCLLAGLVTYGAYTKLREAHGA